MSDFSANFQFNVAQMNSISKELNKNKEHAKVVQEKISQKLEKVETQQHEAISATQEHEDATKVKDNEPKKSEAEEETQSKKKATEEIIEEVVVFKDAQKGNIVDVKG